MLINSFNAKLSNTETEPLKLTIFMGCVECRPCPNGFVLTTLNPNWHSSYLAPGPRQCATRCLTRRTPRRTSESTTFQWKPPYFWGTHSFQTKAVDLETDFSWVFPMCTCSCGLSRLSLQVLHICHAITVFSIRIGGRADKMTLENPRPTRESISQRVFQQTTILEKHVGNSQS